MGTCVQQSTEQQSPQRTTIKEFKHRHAPCRTTSDNELDIDDENEPNADHHQIDHEHPSISTPSYQQHFRSKSKADIQIMLFSQFQDAESDEAITHNHVHKPTMTQSNSHTFQSVTTMTTHTHSCTNTMDQNILSHINHQRMHTNQTIINELEQHYEASFDDKESNITLNPPSCAPSISPNNSPRSLPNLSNQISSNTLFLELIDRPKHIKSQKSAPNLLSYRTRSPSTTSLNLSEDFGIESMSSSANIFSRRLKRSKSAQGFVKKDKQSSKQQQRFNKFSYKKSTKKRKKRRRKSRHHTKSKSIPTDIFSASLSDLQSTENENYEYLSQVTVFDQNTLRLLHLRFNHMLAFCSLDEETQFDDEIVHHLDIHAMAKVLCLPSECILVKRLFDYMDEHRMGLSFRVFARTMSVLSDKADFLEKCKLSFSLYDLNNDNVIDATELKLIIDDLMQTAKEHLHPSVLRLLDEDECSFVDALIANTMQQFELDADGNIGYDAYCRFMQSNPRLLAAYSLDIEKLLDYESEQRRMHRISINSLKKKKLRQIVVGMDTKKKMKWKKPQFLKDLEKDKVQSVHSVLNANQICVDLDGLSEQSELELSSMNDGDGDGDDDDEKDEEAEEKKKQERMQRTIDFLYG